MEISWTSRRALIERTHLVPSASPTESCAKRSEKRGGDHPSVDERWCGWLCSCVLAGAALVVVALAVAADGRRVECGAWGCASEAHGGKRSERRSWRRPSGSTEACNPYGFTAGGEMS